MKIAFILPSLANKGPILVVNELVRIFYEKGIHCEVFYFDDIIELDFKCKTHKISFWDNIDFSGFDVVHTHMLRPDAYGFIRSFKKNIRTKLVTTIHNYFKEDLAYSYNALTASIGERLWRLFWSRYRNVAVLTNSAKLYYSKYINPERLSVVYNGRDVTDLTIDNEDAKLLRDLNDKGCVILGTVASFNARKGLEQVIKVLPNNENYVFVIIGDGSQKEVLLKLARDLGVENRCFFLGPKINGFRYNSFFDVYVIPSRSEGVPLSLLEAVAFKSPVVCSKIDVFVEIFEEDEVSFFQLDDIKSLELAIETALKESDIKVKKAYSKYIIKYTSAAMADNYLKMYIKK